MYLYSANSFREMEVFAEWMVERLKEKPSAIDSAKGSGVD